MALAGFTAAEAEGLRRAMSRKRSAGGDREAPPTASSPAPAANTASPAELAERVWEQIQGFSGFGFPKAHSAAFGLLAYQSAWLRVHCGPEFLCALLNEQPMGFYPPDSLVHEAQRRGIRVAAARRQPQPRPLPRRTPRANAAARRPGGADRARLRQGGARGGDGGAGRRARARRALPGDRRPRLALGRRAGEPRTAGLGGGAGRRSRRDAERRPPRRRSGGSGSPPAAAAPATATQLALPLEPPRAAASWSRWATGGS